MLDLPTCTLMRVVSHVNVVMAVNDGGMGVILEPSNGHVMPPSDYPALVRGTRKLFLMRRDRDGVI